jgi:hypothetical protein
MTSAQHVRSTIHEQSSTIASDRLKVHLQVSTPPTRSVPSPVGPTCVARCSCTFHHFPSSCLMYAYRCCPGTVIPSWNSTARKRY